MITKYWILMIVLLLPCSICDYTNYKDNNVKTHRLSTASVDSSAIYEGVFKPDNIAIHVAQNMVNFIASTLVWAVISYLYPVRNIIINNKRAQNKNN